MLYNILFVVGEFLIIALAYFGGYLLISKLCEAISKRFKGLSGFLRLLQHNLRIIFSIAFFVTANGSVGYSGYLIYQDNFLPKLFWDFILNIPEHFWIDLAIGVGESIGIVILSLIVLRIVNKILGDLCERIVKAEAISLNEVPIRAAFGSLQIILRRVTWLWVLGQSLSWVMIPEQITENVKLAAHVYLIIALGILAWRAVDILIDSFDALSRKYSSQKDLIHYYNRLKNLMPLIRRSVEYMIYLAAATLAMENVSMTAPLAAWGPKLIRIIGLVLLARIFIEIMRLVVEEVLIIRAEISEMEKKSRMTMIPLLLKLMTYLAYFGVGVIVLQEAGFDPLPILAGAGVVGIAVGLGAQDMMKDIISGFSILFEGYYLIGDYVKIDGYEGYVVELDILNTRLRDENGQVHIIRNGKVSSVSNFSKEYTNAVVEILVALETDLDHVERIVKEVGEEVTADEYVLEPTMIDGVLSIDAAGILIRTVTRVAPGKHKVVGRRVRQVLKRSLDRENIETPYSHHIIEHKNPKS